MYEFFVAGEKFESEEPQMTGMAICVAAHVHWPQRIFLEEPGTTPDRYVSDSEVIDLGNGARRFFLVPEGTAWR